MALSLLLHCMEQPLLTCSMPGMILASFVPMRIFACSVLGLDVSRQEPVAPERVHKMRGITTVPASAEVSAHPAAKGPTRVKRCHDTLGHVSEPV
jgi:hypothetical protein